ncbi:nuA4 complex subunit EAF3 [Aphis craccivora]|uniref:NuA4 complex subunit EAF3 n=1 Tax=Aphis craccivora TaxID=307492 RepID=A0A6G0Z5X8_APHCR|nr:nuA4 complex subunit EAF3 [Aphis craccivora]
MYDAIKTLEAFIDTGEEYHFNNNLFPKKMWHFVYGPSYLLRLFVLLPEIVSSNEFLEINTAGSIEKLEYFMKFIETNIDQYFSNVKYTDNK